jgi:hypothetical protein
LHLPLPPPDTKLGAIRRSLAEYTHLPEHSFKLIHAGSVMKDDNAPSVFFLKLKSILRVSILIPWLSGLGWEVGKGSGHRSVTVYVFPSSFIPMLYSLPVIPCSHYLIHQDPFLIKPRLSIHRLIRPIFSFFFVLIHLHTLTPNSIGIFNPRKLNARPSRLWSSGPNSGPNYHHTLSTQTPSLTSRTKNRAKYNNTNSFGSR